MSEKRKVEHLFRGLRPDLKEKLWHLRPKKCTDFLRGAQDYYELTGRPSERSNDWTVAVTHCDGSKQEIDREISEKKTRGRSDHHEPRQKAGGEPTE